MARWYGYSTEAIRAMLLTDFWMLDGFLKRHPPVDILVASYLRVQTESPKGRPGLREVARANADGLAALPPRRHLKTIDQMPEFLRTPGMLKSIQDMREEWAK